MTFAAVAGCGVRVRYILADILCVRTGRPRDDDDDDTTTRRHEQMPTPPPYFFLPLIARMDGYSLLASTYCRVGALGYCLLVFSFYFFFYFTAVWWNSLLLSLRPIMMYIYTYTLLHGASRRVGLTHSSSFVVNRGLNRSWMG